MSPRNLPDDLPCTCGHVLDEHDTDDPMNLDWECEVDGCPCAEFEEADSDAD